MAATKTPPQMPGGLECLGNGIPGQGAMRFAVGYRYSFGDKVFEVVRYGSMNEVSAPNLQMSTRPSHYVVRDESGREHHVAEWLIAELGVEVTAP